MTKPTATLIAMIVAALSVGCNDSAGPARLELNNRGGNAHGNHNRNDNGAPFLRDTRDLMMCAASMPVPGAIEDSGDDDSVAPAPPSIGTDIPLTYFGPAPSDSNPRLIGPVTLLKAGTLDLDAGTITLPLYEGKIADSDESVWYILTDTTDRDNAAALGLNHAAKLTFAGGSDGMGVRTAEYDRTGTLMFDQGTVDFSPVRNVTPGIDTPFPPSVAQPGSVGDADYSPLVRIENAGGHVYNAPIVAFGVEEEDLDFCSGSVDHTIVHDSVVAVCPDDGTVTLKLVQGFSFGRPVLYLSTDTNAPTPAALEGATFAPGLADVEVGGDDSAFSAVERLFAFTNGPVNTVPDEVNPQRQGFFSALSGEGGPLNVLGGVPTIATDYSPLWDVNFGEWTPHAVANGYVSRQTEEFAILGLVVRGFLTGPGGAPFGSSGIIVNCPIVHRFL